MLMYRQHASEWLAYASLPDFCCMLFSTCQPCLCNTLSAYAVCAPRLPSDMDKREGEQVMRNLPAGVSGNTMLLCVLTSPLTPATNCLVTAGCLHLSASTSCHTSREVCIADTAAHARGHCQSRQVDRHHHTAAATWWQSDSPTSKPSTPGQAPVTDVDCIVCSVFRYNGYKFQSSLVILHYELTGRYTAK